MAYVSWCVLLLSKCVCVSAETVVDSYQPSTGEAAAAEAAALRASPVRRTSARGNASFLGPTKQNTRESTP